jgi:hypothetical protein
MNEPLNVIAILGLPYCGSTLLNLMLDSHPDICGVGEVCSLADPSSTLSRVCTNCGEDCPRFTPERVRALGPENFYADIAGFFGASLLADSSKSLEWFAKSTTFPSHRPLRFLPVLVVKHPIRQLLSYALNLDLAQRNRITPYAWFYHATKAAAPNPLGRRPLFRRLARNALFQQLLHWYLLKNSERFAQEIPQVFPDSRPLTVRYEDFVTAPRKTLTPLLAALGLEYSERMADCYAFPHHQIGGNSGTLYQITGNKRDTSADHPCKQAYYSKLRGISMDNRFQAFFDAEELEELLRSDAVRQVCARYGYEPTP